MNNQSTPGSGGYGQMAPTDYASSYNTMVFIIRQMLAALDTMKPVKVVAVHGGGVDSGPGTVDVLPLVQQVDGDGNAQTYGTVYGLPFWRAQGGDGAIVLDPKVDDFGFVIAADRDITNVKLNPAERTPGSNRSFNVADGVYVGGILNAKPVQYVLFTDQGIKVVDRSGNVVETSSTGITLTDVNGNILQMRAGSVNVVTASFQVNGVPIIVP